LTPCGGSGSGRHWPRRAHAAAAAGDAHVRPYPRSTNVGGSRRARRPRWGGDAPCPLASEPLGRLASVAGSTPPAAVRGATRAPLPASRARLWRSIPAAARQWAGTGGRAAAPPSADGAGLPGRSCVLWRPLPPPTPPPPHHRTLRNLHAGPVMDDPLPSHQWPSVASPPLTQSVATETLYPLPRVAHVARPQRRRARVAQPPQR